MAATVKEVDIQLHAQTEEAQRKLDKIVADTEALKKINPEVAVRLDKSAITRQLAVLQAEIKSAVDGISRDAQIEVKVRASFANRLASRLFGLGGGGGRGGTSLFSAIFGIGAGATAGAAQGAGSAAGGTESAGAQAAATGGLPAGGAIAAGIGGGLLAAGTGVGGIVTALTAATAGLGAFAALAIPTFKDIAAGISGVSAATQKYQTASLNLNTAIHKSPADLKAYHASLSGLEPDLRNAAKLLTNQQVQWQNLTPAMRKSVTALSDNKTALKGLLPDQQAALTALLGQRDAWNSLSKGQQQVVGGWQRLSAAFSALADKLAPDVLKVFNAGLKVANTLLPTLLPFAKAAAVAIDGLLKGFNQFAASAGFKQFLAQLLKLSGPSITVIGQGIGQIVIALGKFIIALNTGGHGLQILNGILKGTAIFINILSFVFRNSTKNFDAMVGSFRVGAADIGHAFGNIGHAAGNFAHAWAAAWDFAGRIVSDAVNGIGNSIGAVVRFIARIPGEIERLFASAGTWLLNAGRSIIDGLISGIESRIPGLQSIVSGIASLIPGPIRHLLGISSPSKVLFEIGRNAGLGLSMGLESAMPAVAGVAGAAAGAIIPGTGSSRGYGGATFNLTFNVPPNANMAELGRVTVTAIRQFEKVSGKGWRS